MRGLSLCGTLSGRFRSSEKTGCETVYLEGVVDSLLCELLEILMRLLNAFSLCLLSAAAAMCQAVPYRISTFAGSGAVVFTGEGGAATGALLVRISHKAPICIQNRERTAVMRVDFPVFKKSTLDLAKAPTFGARL